MARPMIRTREQLIKEQNALHQRQARLPYIKKIEMVDKLRDLADIWKG